MILTELTDVSSFIESEFGFTIEKSRLVLYDSPSWGIFCLANGFDLNSEGLYVPSSHSAYVKRNSPVLISNTFHELYGHGLFCEYSQIGRPLATLSREESFHYLYDPVSDEQEFGFTVTNIGNYEGFALWVEGLLCKETDNVEVWNLKQKRLPLEYVNLYNHLVDVESKLSRFGLMAQFGFPKHYDNQRLVETVKRVYCNNNLADILFILVYGSQKPESDIDLFIISSNPSRDYYNGWLDIYGLNNREFIYLAKNLDISVTDPLFSGRIIYGDSVYFETIKRHLLTQPITNKVIQHNLLQAERQEKVIPLLKTKRDKKRAVSYVRSFRRMAERLREGKRSLTLKELLS